MKKFALFFLFCVSGGSIGAMNGGCNPTRQDLWDIKVALNIATRNQVAMHAQQVRANELKERQLALRKGQFALALLDAQARDALAHLCPYCGKPVQERTDNGTDLILFCETDGDLGLPSQSEAEMQQLVASYAGPELIQFLRNEVGNGRLTRVNESQAAATTSADQDGADDAY